MRLWNVEKLAEEFRRGEVSERQQLPYLIIFMLATGLFTDPYITSMMAAPTNSLDATITFATPFITLMGIMWCYRAARAGEAKGFVGRFICLGLPAGIRIGVVLAVVFMVVASFRSWNNPALYDAEAIPMTTPFDVVVALLAQAIYYQYLAFAIRLSYEDGESKGVADSDAGPGGGDSGDGGVA